MARGEFDSPDSLAQRRRRKELASYLEQHQERLEKIAQRCVNKVLLSRPADPYEALLHLLSEHTQEGICFRQLRFWPQAASGSITLEVVAEARGSVLAVHHGELPADLVARVLQAGAGASESSAQDGAARLRATLGNALCGVKALDFEELDRRLLKALVSQPDTPSEDEAALCAAVAGELLVAAGCLLDASAAEAVRSGLELRKEVEPGPPLICQEDLEAWQPRWPELLLPMVQGSTPKRRLCVGATLWAALLPEAASATGGGPAPAWVDYAMRRAREAAIEEMAAGDAEMDDPDEVPLPEPDEYCPPTNAAAMVLALADAVAAKVAAEVPAPPAGDDFAPAVEAFRKALEALVPSYFRPARQAAAAPLGDEEEDEEDEPGPEPLASQQWRGSLYCALHLDADAAFDPSTGSYTFVPGGTAQTQAELVEHYAALCAKEPLLRALVQPLSPRDAGGLAALRARLPPEVLIVQEPVDVPLKGAPAAAPAAEDPGGLGYLRDVTLTPLGLVADCEAKGSLYSGRCGLYDFSDHPALLPVLRGYLDVSVALPEQRRCFLLPRECGSKELHPPIRSLDGHLCHIITSAYGQKNARDGREKHRNVNYQQWKEGLGRLGYKDVDTYAEPLFKFLDHSNNGSISAGELAVMQDISGPASLQDLDEFRIWLCASMKRRQSVQLAGPADSRPSTATAAPAASPLVELWGRMDANGSGLVSFGEFKRALRKMRHPAAVEGSNGKLQELFMCLDLRSDGNICEDDFHCLNVLSAKFQLDRLIRVRDFLQERFGTLKAAFKAMDENRSGTLSKEEWMSVMEGKQSYPVLEDCSVCFQFFDKDGGNAISAKEFDLLGAFDEDKLLDDTQSLYEHLCDKFTDLEEAFSAFLHARTTSRPSSAMTKKSLECRDFLAGCKAVQFKGSTDPRLLFNFLDAMHVGRITLSEFSQMGKLGAVDDLEGRTELMQGAISSLKEFAATFLKEQSPGQEAPTMQECPWTALHRALRDATHGDLDLS